MNKLVPFGVALATAAFIPFASHAAVTTVESGQTLTVTDATVGAYADGFKFADETGVIEFNTTAAPTMDITGAGTVKKTSNSSSWTMSKQLLNFSGDYILQGGGRVTVTGDASGSARYMFGNDKGTLDIRSGAELYAPNTGNMPVFYAKPVKIAGNGANAYGAIQTLTGTHNMSGDFLRNLTLSADARVDLEGSGYLQFFNSSGKFDMDGHELTFVGNGVADFTGAFTIVSNGVINLTCYGTPGVKLQFRNVWAHFEETLDPIHVWDVGSIYFYYDGEVLHNKYPIARPLVVHGKRAMIGIKHQGDRSTPSTFSDMNANVWSSKVTLDGADSLVNMMSTFKQAQFNLTGEVTGEGSVSIGASDLRQTAANESRGRIYFANTNNTYQGFTYVNNFFNAEKWGQFLAAGPHSIPNYSSLTGNYGTVSLRMKERESDDEVLWTDGTYIRDLANEGTWLNRCGIGFDTTFCDGVFTMNYPADITNPDAFIGGSGPGEVLITNAVGTTESPLRLLAAGGVTTVTTKPGERQVVGEFRASAPIYGSDKSILCLKDCDLVMPDGAKFDAGYNISEDGFRKSIQFKNTRLVAENLRNSWTDYSSDVIRPGSETSGKGCGLIEIYDGTVITGRLAVTGTKYGGFGAVYQYGGHVTALGCPSSEANSSGLGCPLGGHNHGYYEMNGGTFVAAGTFAIGNIEGGFWKQTGGSFLLDRAVGDTSTEPQIFVGCGNAQAYAFALHVAGGTFDVGCGRMSVNTGYSEGHQYANVTVTGEGSLIDTRQRYIWPGNKVGAETQFTLQDGGRMRLVGLKKGVDTSKLSVNFDGGIWECTKDNAESGGDVFHTYRTDSRWLQCWADVFVYDGGATVDTAGTKGNGTYRVINGAFGGGITGLAEGFTPYLAGPFEPIVRVYGDGQGAVALADWDKETGMVNGIKVVVPGVGYTTATVKFCSGREASHEWACTIAPNVNTGSFTKAGAGEFFLAATNTWGGATVVKGGSLKANCDWAIPTNTAVRLEGGNLDLNGKVAKISSVTYGAGGGQILNAENAELPATASIVIDIADLVAGNPVALMGDVDLSTMPITITGDVSLLEEGAKYVLATTTDGTFIGKPTYTLEDEPANWGLANRGAKLVYRFVKGALILVR